MVEAIERGIIAGLEQTKPELLQVLVQLGLDSEDAIKELTEALVQSRLLITIS